MVKTRKDITIFKISIQKLIKATENKIEIKTFPYIDLLDEE